MTKDGATVLSLPIILMKQNSKGSQLKKNIYILHILLHNISKLIPIIYKERSHSFSQRNQGKNAVLQHIFHVGLATYVESLAISNFCNIPFLNVINVMNKRIYICLYDKHLLKVISRWFPEKKTKKIKEIMPNNEYITTRCLHNNVNQDKKKR